METTIREYADFLLFSSCVRWKEIDLLNRSRDLKKFRHPCRDRRSAWRPFYDAPGHDDYVASLGYPTFEGFATP